MHENRFDGSVEKLRNPMRMERLEVGRVVDLATKELGKNAEVLDIGTGSGIFAEGFAAKGLRVSGLDANPKMVEEVGKIVSSGEFKLGVAESLPFPDESFDLVFMGLVLHETDDRKKAINEAFRVTRKHLAILEWPKEEDGFRPPMDIRLSGQEIAALGYDAGFSNIFTHRLQNLILYCMEK